MARYTYTIPRNTKGEGRILMIFTKKSFLWTVACAFVGLIVGYLPIGVIFQHPFIGIAITLIFALIGFGIATLKVPNSSNFELFRKTGGENIDEIIDIVSTLIEKGYAYEADGDVYFSPKKFSGYGKLSHQPLEELEAGARIMVGEIKREPMDFALWKKAKPGEPYWESPWGQGRPGWHIECSAMNRRYLGKTIDIHCGGQDLIFPHHENEIAQSECCNDAPFANYWMHNGYITVDNVKMSKSLNNFFTVRDVANEYGYEPIRYLLISSQYRSPINYSTDIIEQCKSSLTRLYTCRDNLDFAIKNAADGEADAEIIKLIDGRKEQFIAAMDDDLNTADALAAIFELVRDINTKVISGSANKATCEAAAKIFDELCSVLGIVYNRKSQSIDSEVEALIEKRTQARKEKNWAEADRIRDELKNMGVVLEDTADGVKWHKV